MPSKRGIAIRPRPVRTFVAITIATLILAPYAWSLDSPSRPPPGVALQQLLDGNARYIADKATHPDSRPSDATQHPTAVILSCSDSRVPPEMVFNQGIGSLFVVRAAGNTYDQSGLESIEYAVAHLGAS